MWILASMNELALHYWDVALKTCQRRWMIGKSVERGSGISMLVAQDDDDSVFSFE